MGVQVSMFPTSTDKIKEALSIPATVEEYKEIVDEDKFTAFKEEISGFEVNLQEKKNEYYLELF